MSKGDNINGVVEGKTCRDAAEMEATLHGETR